MRILLTTAMVIGACAGTVLAQTNSNLRPQADDQGQRTTAGAQKVNGEVKRVDQGAQKITLKHGELKNLGMPSMTMAFRVKDREMLARVRVGDHVRFTAERVNGALTVTSIEPSD